MLRTIVAGFRWRVAVGAMLALVLLQSPPHAQEAAQRPTFRSRVDIVYVLSLIHI